MANWAIVIGVDQYWTPQACLRGAVRDALKMREWLINVDGGAVPTRNLMLLLSPAPTSPPVPGGVTALPATQDMIIQAIEQLLQKSGGQGERFFFYYSGHGLATRMNFSNENGLIPTDFTDLLTTKALTLRSLFELFQATQFQEQFFFIDACRNIPWEREFRIGDYPQPRKATPPVPPQFIMYATSPGVKAIEFQQAGNEGGAFTEALLAGLGGQGNAKVWDDNTEEYVVRWENLFRYVESEVKKKRLPADAQRVPPLIQEPRQFGERGGNNPELGRFPAATFTQEPLDIALDPATVAAQAEVVVSDLGGVRGREAPVAHLPVRFLLEPGTYSVRAVAPNYRMARSRGYYPVDLYGPSTVTVKLLPGQAGPREMGQPVDIAKGLEALAPATLTVRSFDPLAQLEVADNTGKLIQTGRGELTCTNLLPGFYRARLRTPEGTPVEQLIELTPGESESTTVAARALPASGLFHEVITTAGLGVKEDNTLEPSEAIGAVADAHLSTVLALAGGAANEQGGYGERLRRVGVPSFQATVGPQASCGLQILFGAEFGSPEQAHAYLSQVRLRCWEQTQPAPAAEEQPLSFSTTAGLAAFAWNKPPGAYWLALALPEQQPLVLAVTVLPNRLTLLVFHQTNTGETNLYQYLPSLVPEEPGDPRFSAARFPVLRRLELIERAYMSGQLTHAYQNAWELLRAKWVDPMAGCLGGYLLLRLGKAHELAMPAYNLPHYFGGLSDSHLLQAEFAISQGRAAEAVAAYQTALDQGLPIMNDGLARLAEAVQRYQLQHPRAALVQALFNQRVPGLLWSATTVANLQPGQLLTLG